MSCLEAHKKQLYEMRFSPMCKPACEVANLTQLESHSTRARALMLWRIVAGHLSWGEREVEILYESTLDSISEAFDIFHYPISRIMLDARADVWEAGLAPQCVKNVIKVEQETLSQAPITIQKSSHLLLAGELAYLTNEKYSSVLRAVLKAADQDVQIFVEKCGSLAFALGAREVACRQADRIFEGIRKSQAAKILTDGPETAWVLEKVFPEFGLNLPEGVQVQSLCEFLLEKFPLLRKIPEAVFVHDSRPAYFLAEKLPSHMAILPGSIADETAFGDGSVYATPRRILDAIGARRVSSSWTRGLAKSCGADDGLWLTYPNLASGLARQRLEHAHDLGATTLVTNSPLCANLLFKTRNKADPTVFWLPEFLLEREAGQ